MAQSKSGIIGLDRNASVQSTFRLNDVFYETDRVVHFGKAKDEPDQAFGRIFFDSAAALFKVESTKDGTGVTKPMAFLIEGTQAARITAGRAFLVGTVTTVLSTEKLRVDGGIAITDGGSAQYFESTDASSAAVSAAATGRIRYNNAGSGNWQVSVQAGAYVNIITGVGTFFQQDGNSFGALATLGTNDGFALAFETVGVERARILTTGQLLVGRTTVAGASSIAEFEKNQNSVTNFRLINTTDGTASAAQFSVNMIATIGASHRTMTMGYDAPAFTPVGIRSADEGYLETAGAAGKGMVIFTLNAFALRYGTTGIERGRFTATGEFLVGTTVTSTTLIARFVRSHNAETDVLVLNSTDGTSAITRVICNTSSRDVSLDATGSLFTPTDIFEANSGHVRCGSIPTNLIFGIFNPVGGMKWKSGGNNTRAVLSFRGDWTYTQGASPSGTPTFLTYTGAAHTGLANVETISANFNLAQTVTFTGGGGVIAENRTVVFQATTYSSPLAQTITDASTVKITGAPVAAGSLTITNAFALDVTGATRITGKLTVTEAIDPKSVLLSGGAILFFESNDGSSAPVSGGATGRIRYNNAGSGNWQVSVQGGAYVDIATGAANAFVQDGNSFGALATLGTNDGFALAFETVGVERARILTTGEFLIGKTTSVGVNVPLQVFRSGNASNVILLESPTAGTLSRALIQATSDAATVTLGQTSSLFTPAGGQLANEGFMTSSGSSVAIITVTGPMRFSTTLIERGRFTPTGAFLIGSTVTTGATQLLLVKKNQDTDTLATVENLNATASASCAFQAKTGTSRVIAMRAHPAVGVNANVAQFLSNGMRTIRFEMFGVASTLRFFQWREGPTGEELMDLNRVSGLRVKQLVNTLGTPNAIVVTGAAHTGLANVEVISANFNFSQTVSFAGGGGAIAENRTVVFQAPTYSSPLAQTITVAATVKITGAPGTAGSLTIDQPLAFFVGAGESRFGGFVAFDAASPAAFVGNQNNLALASQTIQRISSTGAINITGFVAPPTGRWIKLVNVGSFNITITNQDAASAASARTITGTGGSLVMAPDDVLELWYDLVTARWRVMS